MSLKLSGTHIRYFFIMILCLSFSCLTTHLGDSGRIETTCGELKPLKSYKIVVPPHLKVWGPYIQTAADRWNSATKKETFILYYSISDLEPAISLAISKTKGPTNLVFLFSSGSPRTFTRLHWKNCKIEWAEMFVSSGISESDMEIVSLHELGHILGLAHDENESSVMRRINPGMMILPNDKKLVE